MLGLTKEEIKLFKKLSSPQKIQDFLESVPFNFEPNGDTLRSPRVVLREGTAHCLEGALFAATALWLQGRPPLLLDLCAAKGDFDHVVVLFKEGKYWGALSKTNHGVLRYRDPIYLSVRELAMSYFHEYFLKTGKKTLRAYSAPFDLRKYKPVDWVTSEENLWDLEAAIDQSPHYNIVTPAQIRKLRNASPIEIKIGEIVEWKKK